MRVETDFFGIGISVQQQNCIKFATLVFSVSFSSNSEFASATSFRKFISLKVVIVLRRRGSECEKEISLEKFC